MSQSIYIALVAVVLYTMVGHAQNLPVPPYAGVSQSHSFVKEGLLQRSRAILRNLQRSYGTSASFDEAEMDRGQVLRDRGMAERAKDLHASYARQYVRSPASSFSALEAGFIAIELGDYPSAIEYLQRAALFADIDKMNRNDSLYRLLALQTHFWLGSCYAQTERFDDAYREWTVCEQLGAKDTLAAHAMYAIGQAQEINGLEPEAYKTYDRVMQTYPRSTFSAEAQARRAVIDLRKRLPAKAIDDLQGIDLDVLHFRQIGDSSICDVVAKHVLVVRTQALAMQQLYDRAIDSVRAYLRRYPASDYEGLQRLVAGYAFLYTKQVDSALAMYDAIIASALPEDSEVRQQALLYRALCLAKVGRETDAEQLYTGLSMQSGYPFKAHALIEVGQIFYERGEFDKAIKQFEKAEREAHDATVILRSQLLLGSALIQRQQWARAATVHERALVIAEAADQTQVPLRNEYLAVARLNIGICLAQVNQPSKAITALTDYLGNHPADPRRDEATFWLAEMMYRENLLKNAQELYEEIVRRYTASQRREEAMYGLAWTFFRKRDFTRSSKAFEELISSYPNSQYVIEAMVRRADGLYISRQFKAAATQYEEAAAKGKHTDEAQYAAYQAGQAAYRGGEIDHASDLMRRFIQRFPKSRLADDAMYLIGWVAFQKQDDEGAIREFERLLQAYPDGDHAVRAQYTIADAHYNLGNYEQSIATYRSVMSQYPSHPLATEAAKSLQEVLVGQGRIDEALSVLDTLIGANPGSVAAEDFTWSKAQIFYAGKNYATAAAELSAYLKKYPSTQRKDEALYQLGKTYLTMSDLAQAIANFQELEHQFPSSPFVLSYRLDMGYYYATNANMTASDSVYSIVWNGYPADTAAASLAGYELAEHARMRGDTSKAVSQYLLAADRYPTSPNGAQARYKLAQLYRKNGQIDSARFHLQLLAQQTSQPSVVANVFYDLGTTYFRERAYEKAAEYFVRVREDYAGIEDWYTLSMLALGECFEQLAQKDQALDAYQTIAALRPDDDYGKTAAARVKRLKGGRK